MARDRFRQLCFDGQLHAATKFEVDKDLVEMRSYFSAVILICFINFFRNSMRCSKMDLINISKVTGQRQESTSIKLKKLRALLTILLEISWQF